MTFQLLMPDSLISEPESSFVCGAEKWMRSACQNELFYRKHEGKQYCVLHLPLREKSADFDLILKRKLENKDFNFRGVWFPDPLSLSKFDFVKDADFRSATFSADADFARAAFSGVANFSAATFMVKADFRAAIFSADANFGQAAFKGTTHFRVCYFQGVGGLPRCHL